MQVYNRIFFFKYEIKSAFANGFQIYFDRYLEQN